jgi:hypothetical protein
MNIQNKRLRVYILRILQLDCYQGSNFIAAIAVEGEQNAVDHCGNDGNFLPYSAIFILFTVHYYFDTCIQGPVV